MHPKQQLEAIDILHYWYSASVKKQWFSATPELDAEIHNRYALLWRQAADGLLDRWKATPEGCLALCIILDQFPLNMFRGKPESFATEAQAISVSKYAIKQGYDKQIEKQRLAFLYMPLMHSEDLADQKLSVELFKAANLQNNIRFAEHHLELISKFHRFPHRNSILGRKSTSEEMAYLASKHAFKG